MGLGGMPRKKKDDIDWDNLDGESNCVPRFVVFAVFALVDGSAGQ